jgi:demethylmenaquinone methyltransferase / 2-methoxy-6-polyprenyl-1,4-benzoquinol methylase
VAFDSPPSPVVSSHSDSASLDKASLDQSIHDKASYNKAQEVQHMFDSLAPRYDWLNQVISAGQHWRWKHAAVAALNLSAGNSVLDVCTGTGDNLGLMLAAVGPAGEVTGLDFSANMLAVAQQRYPQAANGIRLIQGDALALPFEANTFEGALISFGLRNVVNKPLCLQEMARVVKPGGWVVNLDTAPDPWLPGFKYYFQYVMPLIGRLLGGHPSAYSYLARSTANFDTPMAIVDMFEKSGLQSVYVKRLTFGAVALVAGQVP